MLAATATTGRGGGCKKRGTKKICKKKKKKKMLLVYFASCSPLINCVCLKDKGTGFLEIVVIDARLSTKALLIFVIKKASILKRRIDAKKKKKKTTASIVCISIGAKLSSILFLFDQLCLLER